MARRHLLYNSIVSLMNMFHYDHIIVPLFQDSLLHLWNAVSTLNPLCCPWHEGDLSGAPRRQVISNSLQVLNLQFWLLWSSPRKDPMTLWGREPGGIRMALFKAAEQRPLWLREIPNPTQTQVFLGGHQLSTSGMHFPLAKPPRQNWLAHDSTQHVVNLGGWRGPPVDCKAVESRGSAEIWISQSKG